MATVPVGDRGLGAAESDRAFFGHPRGLSTLFFSEMWERFSYYGMRGFLLLYMTTAAAAGGLGLDTATAAVIYGVYTSSVYLMNIPGGWLADRVLGQRKAVLYGGIFIAAGHFSLAVPAQCHLLPRPAARRGRHRPAQAQHQRHRRTALRPSTTSGATRRFRSSTGHQPRRVPRPDHHRVPRAARALPGAHHRLGHGSELGVALGICRGGRRHDVRSRPVRAGLAPPRHGRPASADGQLACGVRARQAAGDAVHRDRRRGDRRARRRHRHGRRHRHERTRDDRLLDSAAHGHHRHLRVAVQPEGLDAGRAQAALHDRACTSSPPRSSGACSNRPDRR